MQKNILWMALILSLVAGCHSPSSSTQRPFTSLDLAHLPLNPPLPMPVHGVKRQQLQDTWGASRGQGRQHEGIDIFAPRGTKIYSVTHGIITDLRDTALGGKVIWIRGPSNSWHYYAHLDGYAAHLKIGNAVQQGQVIGYVGNSGNARHTRPHLHYGLYLQGKGRGAVNPYPYLRSL